MFVFAPLEMAIRTANASALGGECQRKIGTSEREDLQLSEFPCLFFHLLGFTAVLYRAIYTTKETLISALVGRIRRTRRLSQRRHPRRKEEESRFRQDDQRDQEQDQRWDRQSDTPREEVRGAKVGRSSAFFRFPGTETDDLVDGADHADAGTGVEAFHVGFEDVRVEGDVWEHGPTEVGLRVGQFVRGQEEGVVDLL